MTIGHHQASQLRPLTLEQGGYPTRYMNRDFKDFGATMRERKGTVSAWLSGMPSSECSDLIERLKTMQPEPAYRASEDPEVQALKDAAGEDRDTAELRRIAGLK